MAMIRTMTLAVAFAALLAGCAGAKPVPSAPDGPARFAFHDRFWVNLHQRLYAESSERFPEKAPQQGSDAFTEDERGKWDAALAFYRAKIPNRGALTFFEAPLSDWNDATAKLADDAKPDGLEPELAAHLQAAGEVYRTHGWAADRASNEAWIADVSRRLDEQGPEIFAELERIYATKWPAEPIEVQVSRHAGFLGAYTSTQPSRISINSGLPHYRGAAGLEMILHEASHLLVDPTTAAMEAECAKQGKPVPASLWHALLFFSTGEIVRKRVPDYSPYAYANGLYARAWPTLEPLLRTHWLPFIEGKVDRQTALSNLVAGLPAAGE